MSGLGHKNPAVQHLRRLSGRRRSRLEASAFVIDGPVLVAEALVAGVAIETVFVEPGDDGAVAAEVEAAAARAVDTGATRHDVAPGVLARAVDPVTPHGIAAVATLPPSRSDLASVLARPAASPPNRVGDPAGGPAPVLVLAGVSDPGNAGTLLRSAEAAGVAAVVATAGSVDLYAPKVVRSSAGSLFRVPVVVDVPPDRVVDELHRHGLRTVATVVGAPVTLDDADLTGPLAVVLGNEAHGLDRGLADRLTDAVTIPMAGRVESLNVAMAGTVVLFEAARQRRSAGR